MFPWPFRPVWAPHARGTWHRHREYAIQFYDFDSGETTELYRKEGPFQHAWLAVSPDGAWVLYGEAPMGTSELMLVENFRRGHSPAGVASATAALPSHRV